MHKLNLNGLAVNPIRLESGQLKGIREKAYAFTSTTAKGFNYSLLSLFGPTNSEILRSCLTVSQIEAANKDGAYGDLARNAIIAKPMEDSAAFESTYKGFDHNNTIVMYLGSTDGGVGNTLLDPDLNSLFHYIASNAWPMDKSRDYRVYSFRTLPYKKFTPDNPDPIKAANAKRILEEMVPQSKGVICNLDTRDDYVRAANITKGVPYKLDALFISGYAVNDRSQFDDTNAPETSATSNPDSQTHRSHIVELVSALMMVDCLNEDKWNRLFTDKLPKSTKAAIIKIAELIFMKGIATREISDRWEDMVEYLSSIKNEINDRQEEFVLPPDNTQLMAATSQDILPMALSNPQYDINNHSEILPNNTASQQPTSRANYAPSSSHIVDQQDNPPTHTQQILFMYTDAVQYFNNKIQPDFCKPSSDVTAYHITSPYKLVKIENKSRPAIPEFILIGVNLYPNPYRYKNGIIKTEEINRLSLDSIFDLSKKTTGTITHISPAIVDLCRMVIVEKGRIELNN